VHLTGLPTGVKDGGGILETILRDLDVRCLPTAIPPSIQVDVSHLNIGDSVHVRDVSMPDVVILNDGDETIATVVPPTVMEEKAAEEVVTEAAPTEPEVITKGKKDEDEVEAGEGKEKEKEKEKKEEKGKK
jgi:large subunit ribosomal protein L25